VAEFRRRTVDAYYNPQRNDINFPAGAAAAAPVRLRNWMMRPNYGRHGPGTIGTSDSCFGTMRGGQQFDAKRQFEELVEGIGPPHKKFDERTKCVSDQYSQYGLRG